MEGHCLAYWIHLATCNAELSVTEPQFVLGEDKITEALTGQLAIPPGGNPNYRSFSSKNDRRRRFYRDFATIELANSHSSAHGASGSLSQFSFSLGTY